MTCGPLSESGTDAGDYHAQQTGQSVEPCYHEKERRRSQTSEFREKQKLSRESDKPDWKMANELVAMWVLYPSPSPLSPKHSIALENRESIGRKEKVQSVRTSKMSEWRFREALSENPQSTWRDSQKENNDMDEQGSHVSIVDGTTQIFGEHHHWVPEGFTFHVERAVSLRERYAQFRTWFFFVFSHGGELTALMFLISVRLLRFCIWESTAQRTENCKRCWWRRNWWSWFRTFEIVLHSSWEMVVEEEDFDVEGWRGLEKNAKI